MTSRLGSLSAAQPLLGWGLGLFFLTILCLVSAKNVHAETTLYVQSLQAALYVEPRLGAAKGSVAKKGEPLTAGQKQKSWYPVRYNNQDLWIPALLVSERPPIHKVSPLQQSAENLAPTARKRASAFTTAAAARGLQESERQRISGRYQARDFTQLEKIENMALTPEEIMAFLPQAVQQ